MIFSHPQKMLFVPNLILRIKKLFGKFGTNSIFCGCEKIFSASFAFFIYSIRNIYILFTPKNLILIYTTNHAINYAGEDENGDAIGDIVNPGPA